MRQLVLVLTEFYWFFLLYRKCQPICSHRKNLNRSNSDADSVAQTCVTKTWLGSCGWWGSWLDRTCLWNKGVHCLPVVWEPEKGYLYMNTKLGNAAELLAAVDVNSCCMSPLVPPPPTRAQPDWTELTSSFSATLSGNWDSDAIWWSLLYSFKH